MNLGNETLGFAAMQLWLVSLLVEHDPPAQRTINHLEPGLGTQATPTSSTRLGSTSTKP